MTLNFRAFLAGLVLFAIVLFISFNAHAADATVSWTMPATNTDGSAIPASGAGSIASTRVEYGSCSGTAFGTKAGEVTVPAPATSTTITGFAAGSTACFRAYVKNTYGTESAPSGVVSKTFPTPTPNPPTIVTIATTAYDVQIGGPDGVKLGRNVGTVPLGTACGEEVVVYTRKGLFYEVPRDAVSLSRQPRSSVVVAKCAAT